MKKSNPPNKIQCAQIFTYLIIITQAIIFSVCVQSNIYNYQHRIIMIILFYLSFISVVISCCITSCIDTSYARIDEFNNKVENVDLTKDQYRRCDECKCDVRYTSYHCKQCKKYSIIDCRCIIQFDHHCVWINKCIGKYNYRSFLCMIISTFINLTTFVSAISILWSQMRWNQFMQQMIINWIMLFIIVIPLIFMLLLIIFHAYLIYHGKTQYQFSHSQPKSSKVLPLENIKSNDTFQQKTVNQNQQKNIKQTENMLNNAQYKMGPIDQTNLQVLQKQSDGRFDGQSLKKMKKYKKRGQITQNNSSFENKTNLQNNQLFQKCQADNQTMRNHIANNYKIQINKQKINSQ